MDTHEHDKHSVSSNQRKHTNVVVAKLEICQEATEARTLMADESNKHEAKIIRVHNTINNIEHSNEHTTTNNVNEVAATHIHHT